MCMQDYQILRHIKPKCVAYTAAGVGDVTVFERDEARWGFALSVPTANTAYLYDTIHGNTTLGMIRVASNSAGTKILSFDMVGAYVHESFTLYASGALSIVVTELFLDVSDKSLKKYLETPK